MRWAFGVVVMLVPVAAVVAVLVWLLGWGWALGAAGVAALAVGVWTARQFAAGRLTFVRRVHVGDGLYQDIEYAVASPAAGLDPASALEMRAREYTDAGQRDLGLSAFRRAVELRREQAGSGREEDARCGEHLLSPEQPPQGPDEWERWWLQVARKAISQDHLVYHESRGPKGDVRSHLVHTSCHRSLMSRERMRTAQPSRASAGLLEPCAATSSKHGSEGAGAQQCAPATRP